MIFLIMFNQEPSYTYPPVGKYKAGVIFLSCTLQFQISIEVGWLSTIYHSFLSDPSPIIGNACHSLTHSCLVNLIDVTLACEDDNSKLVEVVTVVEGG